MNHFWKEVWDWIYSIIVALALAMLIHIFIFVPTRVAGESMVPTLHNGQYLLVSKISHVLRELPDYGQIVIIDSTRNGRAIGVMISRSLRTTTCRLWIPRTRRITFGSNASSLIRVIVSVSATGMFTATAAR